MTRTGAVRLAFVTGLAIAALSASSIVAWRFGWPEQMGAPLFWHFYDPLDVYRWGRMWWAYEDWRRDFVAALSLALVVLVAPLVVVRLLEMYGPLKVERRGKNTGLGRAEDLFGTGHVVRRGDGFVIGAAGRSLLRDTGDGHVLVMGPARSGKGTGHVVPTLLSHSGSILVFDPKHELAEITARRREQFGPVHIFDPTSTATARFNPLLELRTDIHMIADAQRVANAMTHLGEAPNKDPFWDEAAAELLSGILVHVIAEGDRDLAHVWRCVENIGADKIPVTHNSFAARCFAIHAAREDRLRSNVMQTVLTRLAFLADPVLQAATSRSDFRAGDLQAGPDPVTVYLSVPVSEAQRLRPLTRLMLRSLFDPLTTQIKVTGDGREKQRGVLFLLDEFPQLGRMDVLETGIAVCAGYGVRVAMVCQDEDQIRSAYGANQAITANCATICVIPGFSGHSLQTVARWAGEHAVVHASKSIGSGWRGTPSQSESETRVPVLNARDMLRRGRREVLVFTLGCGPVWLRKAPYYERPEFRGCFDDHRIGPVQTGTDLTDARRAWLRA